MCYNQNGNVENSAGLSAAGIVGIEMSDALFGSLIIDSELNIVGFNKDMETLFPKINTGEKCYRVLSENGKPCSCCPIAARDVHHCATIDRCSFSDITELSLTPERRLYMLNFKSETPARKVPSDVEKASKSLYIQGIINSLTGDIRDIYEIDVKTRKLRILSFTHNAKAIANPIENNLDVDEITEIYIKNNVHPDDMEEFRAVATFASMCAALKEKSSFTYHFRVLRNNKINYCYMKCARNGAADSFDKVIMAFALEDFSVNLNNMVKANSHISQNQRVSRIYEERFAEALENKEFVVWYQPKFDAFTEKIVGAEALIRWQTPNGMIPPGDFLDVFEADGLIQTLDKYVFREVCKLQRRRMDNKQPLIPISVNLSRKSLFSPGIVETYKDIADSYGIDTKYIPIEITESVALANKRIKPIADKFISVGFELQMDDFGSGESALNGLNMMHFTVVKLDKSLIDFIGQKNGDLILNYAMALGKELGVQLVAEGVETIKQLNFLRNNHCDIIQGYYFSKPLPLDEFEAKLNLN